MNAFLIDLWNDLREKRLWPVAALLLLGLIAVPIVLSEPSKEPVSTVVAVSPPSESGATKGLAALTVAKDDTGDGSSLDVFDSSNPFKPPQDIIANSDDTTAGPTIGTTGDTGSTGAVSAATAPTRNERHAAPDPRGGTAIVKKTTTEYRYVIDATFITNGEKRKIDGMDALSVLPSHSNALLVFLGVRSKGGNAVFIVDSTLYGLRHRRRQVQAEARTNAASCTWSRARRRPSRPRRATPTPSGFAPSARSRSATSRPPPRRRRLRAATTPRARRQSRAATPSTRFVPQFLSDLVSVSGGSDASDQTGPIVPPPRQAPAPRVSRVWAPCLCASQRPASRTVQASSRSSKGFPPASS